MAKRPASERINVPDLKVPESSTKNAMIPRQCVVSIIECLAECADLVESIQMEQERSLKKSAWKFWERLKAAKSKTETALCESIVNSANQLGQALREESLSAKASDLSAIRVDIQNKLRTPMQKELDSESTVTDSQLNIWKELLENLMSRALQDFQLR